MAGVTFEHMSKRFGDVTAISDFNLDIKDQEFLVLVGPSGCGKSTALRSIAGLEEVTEGVIRIGERVVNDVPPKDRDIAMVFQSYALYPHMSVYDNMAFGLKLRKTPKTEIDRRVQEAARILDIGGLLDRKPKQLSGGQRQRVALGRAIVREPAVFLLDEPLSNLDAKLRVQTRAEISRLHQRLGTTFIYVTHDQVEAMTMADRIAVMNLGVLQQVDTPQNLYNHPTNIFVAGFIGSPAMNFFESSITGDSQEMYVDTGAFRLRLEGTARSRAANYLGQKVILGIRPDNIHHPEYLPSGVTGVKIKAAVELTELMGNEINAYLVVGNTQRFVARIDPRARMRAGDQLDLLFDTGELHIFDPTTEAAIYT